MFTQATHSSHPRPLGHDVATCVKAEWPIFKSLGQIQTGDTVAPSFVGRLACCCLKPREKESCEGSGSKYLARKVKSEDSLLPRLDAHQPAGNLRPLTAC